MYFDPIGYTENLLVLQRETMSWIRLRVWVSKDRGNKIQIFELSGENLQIARREQILTANETVSHLIT